MRCPKCKANCLYKDEDTYKCLCCGFTRYLGFMCFPRVEEKNFWFIDGHGHGYTKRPYSLTKKKRSDTGKKRSPETIEKMRASAIESYKRRIEAVMLPPPTQP